MLFFAANDLPHSRIGITATKKAREGQHSQSTEALDARGLPPATRAARPRRAGARHRRERQAERRRRPRSRNYSRDLTRALERVVTRSVAAVGVMMRSVALFLLRCLQAVPLAPAPPDVPFRADLLGVYDAGRREIRRSSRRLARHPPARRAATRSILEVGTPSLDMEKRIFLAIVISLAPAVGLGRTRAEALPGAGEEAGAVAKTVDSDDSADARLQRRRPPRRQPAVNGADDHERTRRAVGTASVSTPATATPVSAERVQTHRHRHAGVHGRPHQPRRAARSRSS